MKLSLAWKNDGLPTRVRRRTKGMVNGSEREHRLAQWRVRGADHLRSVQDGSENRGTKLFPTELGLGRALVLLLMLRLLGQGLLLGVAGATLILMLQELVDP